MSCSELGDWKVGQQKWLQVHWCPLEVSEDLRAPVKLAIPFPAIYTRPLLLWLFFGLLLLRSEIAGSFLGFQGNCCETIAKVIVSLFYEAGSFPKNLQSEKKKKMCPDTETSNTTGNSGIEEGNTAVSGKLGEGRSSTAGLTSS